MRVPPQFPLPITRELSDADRARIDERNARFGAARGFAEAGLVVEEDFRKVAQMYEQLNAEATRRGETFPALETWLRQRADERIARGFVPGTSLPAYTAPAFEALLGEAGERGETASPSSPGADAGSPARVAAPQAATAPAAVDELFGQLALGRESGAAEARTAAPAPGTPTAALDAAAAAVAEKAAATVSLPAPRLAGGDPGARLGALDAVLGVRPKARADG